MRRYLAEFIAAFSLVFAGCGAVIVNQITDGGLGVVGIAMVFGLIIMAMIYATGDISGAHINPAVTIAFALTRNFPVREVIPYIVAQVAGAMVGALALLAIFGNIADLGTTLPAGSVLQSLWLEVVLTFLLMFVIMSVATGASDKGLVAAIAIGATVGLDALFGGPVSGASMNPARSLGPALVSGNLEAIWVYILGPVTGAALGALAFSYLANEPLVTKGAPEAG